MFSLSPFGWIVSVLSAEDSPKQLAAGFALGMVIGLVPKGNLAAQLLIVALAATQCNFGAGLLSAFLFSWVGLAVDPVADKLGLGLLQAGGLQGLWTWLYNLPVVPWTAFNNSAVLGNLVLGALLAYPAYRLSLPGFTRLSPVLAEKLKKYKVARALNIAEKARRFKA